MKQTEYVFNDALCKALNVKDDEEAVEDMCKLALNFLKAHYSICAIDEETDEIIGFALMKPMYQSNYSWYDFGDS